MPVGIYDEVYKTPRARQAAGLYGIVQVEHRRTNDAAAANTPALPVPESLITPVHPLDIDPVDIATSGGIELDPWQISFLRGQTRQVLINASRQVGKELSVNTPIATPTGWTTMGEITPGDYVFDAAGQPTRVLWVSPIRKNPAYRVMFDDGSKIIANAEHLWTTLDAHARQSLGNHQTAVPDDWWNYESPGSRDRAQARDGQTVCLFVECGRRAVSYGLCPGHHRQKRLGQQLRALVHPTSSAETRTTAELRATLRTGARGDTNHAIPMTAPLALPDASLLVDPYVLGVWLGDGSRGTSCFTKADSDGEIVERVEQAGYTVGRMKNGNSVRRTVYGLSKQLRALGVWTEKRIPPQYLRASVDQRKALLAGLMDTDGTVTGGSHNVPAFDTTSEALKDGVSELLVSLGCAPRVSESRAMLYGKDCGPTWTVSFLPTFQPFRLARKADRLKLNGPRQALRRLRYVTGIEEAGACEMRCIAVESDSHLYLAGKAMIPTHNSTVAAVLAIHGALTEARSLQIILSPSADQSVRFFKTIKDFYDRMGKPVVAESESQHQLTLENGSRIVALSSNPRTVRGFASVRRILIDEAAFVSDDLYTTVRPMLAISGGDLIAMSTPNGEQGWWYEAWVAASDDWVRYMIPATECPRYTVAFLQKEQRSMPRYKYEQEYECKFVAAPGQLFTRDMIMSSLSDDLEPLFDQSTLALSPGRPTVTPDSSLVRAPTASRDGSGADDDGEEEEPLRPFSFGEDDEMNGPPTFDVFVPGR